MRVNSASRIAKRRQGALVRRQADIKMLGELGILSAKTEEDRKTIVRKLGIAKFDVDNLQKKGVRA